jgi:hypothetical protein
MREQSVQRMFNENSAPAQGQTTNPPNSAGGAATLSNCRNIERFNVQLVAS